MNTLLTKSYLISLLIICSCKSIAQDNYVDSLKRILQTEKNDTNKIRMQQYISVLLTYTRSDAAFALGKQSLELAKKLNCQRGIAQADETLANLYSNISDKNQALESYF